MATSRRPRLQAKALADRDTVQRAEAHLESLRKQYRKSLLAWFEDGESLSSMAIACRTSYSRMSRNIQRGKAERTGAIS